MTNREVELIELLKITDTRFVKNVVVPEEIRLAHVPFTKAIQDRRRDIFDAIRHRVDDVLSLLSELVSVVSVFESETVACREDLAIRRDLECVGHRRR